jgi:predicted permease
MTNLLLLLACFILGALARRFLGLPAETPKVLGAWLIWISLPALILKVVHRVPLEPVLLFNASVLWLEFAVAAGLAWLAVKRGWASAGVAGATALCCGLGNTSFVGLPLLEALGGPVTQGPTALTDQLGSFGAVSVLAVPFAARLAGKDASVGAVLRRLASFPPLVALLVALATRSLAYPAPVEDVLTRLGDMLSPLALASVGFQLDVRAVQGQGRPLVVGLLFKLLAAPAMAFALVLLFRPGFGLWEKVAVAEAAMAPMVVGSVLATEHGFEPKLAAAFVAIGVPLGFLTVPAWWWLCGAMG